MVLGRGVNQPLPGLSGPHFSFFLRLALQRHTMTSLHIAVIKTHKRKINRGKKEMEKGRKTSFQISPLSVVYDHQTGFFSLFLYFLSIFPRVHNRVLEVITRTRSLARIALEAATHDPRGVGRNRYRRRPQQKRLAHESKAPESTPHWSRPQKAIAIVIMAYIYSIAKL